METTSIHRTSTEAHILGELTHIYDWYESSSTDKYGRIMRFYMLYRCLNQHQDEIVKLALEPSPLQRVEWMEYCGNLLLKGVKYYSKYERGKYNHLPRELIDDFIQELLNYQEWVSYLFVRWNEQCHTLTSVHRSCRTIRDALNAIQTRTDEA